MTKAHIRFSPDILRRLGEELNPSADQGILELVKNSYDADARRCVVELRDTDQAGGTVVIKDDGDGMDIKDIREGWLVLGRSPKSKRGITRLGRIPAGSKGLGRLAALRLGTSAILKTNPRQQKGVQYKLGIDWDAFESTNVVEDVALEIKRSENSDRTSGTEIELRGLRRRITRIDVKRLARAMVLLADPFGKDPGGFDPELVTPEFEDLEALVRNRYFRDADFHLSAHLHEDGTVSADITDWKGEKLYHGSHDDIAVGRKGDSYLAPAAMFDFWAFLLDQKSFASRPTSLGEVRNWLQAFGGVHLYYNGLRAAPYGNPGSDWLEINLRRAQSPEERPSTNTSIGRVAVVDKEDRLMQKTDRSGFIEDEAFAELRAYAQDSLEWMARRRMETAEKRRAAARAAGPKRSSRSRTNLEEVIQKAPTRTRDRLKKAFSSYDRARDREVRQLRKEVQLYRTLSTAGITAATFAHESQGNPLKVLSQVAKTIERRTRELLGKEAFSRLSKSIDRMKRAVRSIGTLTDATLGLIAQDKRRVGRVDVHDVVESVLKTFEPFIEGRDVNIDTDLADARPYLRGSEAAIEAIITNFLNNSLVALETVAQKARVIKFTTKIEGDTVLLCVTDNGPGIEGVSASDVWLPGVTTRLNGTGLGLTIVRDTVKDLGGHVEAIATGELGGAEFRVILPILGA